MARDRSRSPRKDTKKHHRSRSRSRSRGRDRDQERKRRRIDKTRSRSRSPRHRRRSPRSDEASKGHRSHRDHNSRRRSRSRSRDDDVVFICEQRPGENGPSLNNTPSNPVDLTGKVTEASGEDEFAMMKLMGFANFDSTKGKKVGGNEDGVSRINVKRKYRQYMNRVGGFNRPLDPVH